MADASSLNDAFDINYPVGIPDGIGSGIDVMLNAALAASSVDAANAAAEEDVTRRLCMMGISGAAAITLIAASQPALAAIADEVLGVSHTVEAWDALVRVLGCCIVHRRAGARRDLSPPPSYLHCPPCSW